MVCPWRSGSGRHGQTCLGTACRGRYAECRGGPRYGTQGRAGASSCPACCENTRAFWDEVVLLGHHLREALGSYVRDGVSVYEFLVKSHKGTSVDSLYNGDKFPGAVFANRIPPAHAAFKAEMRALIARGCVVKRTDVRGPAGRERPRMIQALSVEETKPRLIYDAQPLNKDARGPLSPWTPVGRVAQVASEGCFQGSLDDSSGFHHVLLYPAS